MFIYRVFDQEGNGLEDASYVSRIKPEETIWLSGARKVKVVDVVDTHGEGKYEGLLVVTPTGRQA